MKKIICTIALMLQLVCLSAQINRPVSTEIYKDEYFILNSGYGQPISYEFYAGDSIILDEGFFRNYSNGQYYFTMDLVVDDIGVYPPTAGTQGGPSEGDNGYVGALDGTFDVGMMGGAAYTIPIDLPSGINGMQPSLALCYNSQGGNGLLGWKWDLAGLSSVTRTGRTLYHDGVIGGVTLSDDTDRFQLDGQRLMPVHDYTDSVDYKTEQDGLARIRAYWENDTIGNGRHIKNFKVWDPDGTILEYGFTIDSRIDPQNGGEKALCWLLNKTTDRQGNSVLYHYTELQETGEYYIHSIEYTCNDLLFIKPKYHIIFNYTDRSDYEFSYVKGNTIQNKRLLSSIVVTDNEETVLQCHTLNYSDVWEYAAYDYSKNKMYHRLLSVEFEKGGMKLNPTKITWEYDENNVYQHNVCNKIPLDTTYLNNFVFVGDFNADGFSDVITVPYKDDSVYSHPVDMNVLLNTGNGEFQYSPALSMNTNNGHPLATNLDWIHVIDINDDGYDDIIIQYYTYLGNNLGSSSLMLYLNYDGVMFYPAWASPIVAPQRLYLTLGDYLGNGRQNALACVFLDNFSTIPLLAPLFYIHNENGTSTCDTIFNPHVRLANDLVSGDFDGDGHTEIMIVDTLGAKMYRLRQSGSNLLFEEKQYGSEIIYDSALNMFPGDYNGDGKEDLLCYGKKNASDELSWFFLMSSGVDFRCKATHVFEGLNFAPREKMYTYSLEKVTNSLGFAVFVSDFDGDGCCDIALSRDFPYNNSLCIYSKFVKSTMVVISGAPDYNTIYHNTFNPLAKINAGSLNTRSQYIHAGNFFSKDNLSILGNEVTSKSSVRKPVLCDIYSLHEYNSVTCITDGMGTPLRMSYAYPAVAGVNQINFENGIARLNVPVRTLKSVTSYKTNDAELTTTYSFSNAMLHKNGHGYLGFLKQEATNTINGVNVSKRISLFETLTMGAYAFSLPMQETTCIFKDNEGWLTSTKTDFEFRRVVSTRNQKVVKPAMTRQTSIYFNTDNPSFPDECLKKEIVEYDYSIGPDSTYYNSYNCIEARTGVDSGIDNDFNSCEFKTVESFDFYPNQTNPWIINRLHKKTIVQSRTGKPDVIHSFWYEYTSNDSYQIKRLFDFPSLNNQDTLMVQTDFEYHEEGNLKKKTIRVPYGQQGEHARIVEYEYGPGEGSSNQRRLVTKETTRSGDLTYQTKYNYDLFDHLDTLIASNGLVTGFENDALGIVKTSTNPNGTHSGSALRWAEGYDYAPLGAMYFSWSRSSGNNKTLTFFHHTGAELRSVSFGLNGEAIFVDKEYDSKGRLWKVSNPYKDGDAVLYTEYQYDNQDRLTSTVTPDGTTTRIEYLGNQTKTTVSANGSQPHKSTITVNAMGWTVRSDDASGNSYVTYDHYADGLLASATVNNDPTTTVSATFDYARNRSTLTDPNYGTLTTVYNAYGELCQRVSPKELDAQTETTYLYDGLGRLVRETDGLENTTTHYIFDEEEGATKGLLKDIHHRTVGGQAIQYISYNYDDFARLIMTKDQRSSGIYTTSMEYDDYSRIKQTTYPTGVSIRNKYENGYLKSIIDANDHVLWKADGINAYGQLTDATLGNGVTTHRAYDPEMHYIDSIVTSNNLQNLSYGYDKFGNLASRKDNLRNLEESFHYDDMNRLTDIYLGNTHSQIVYDPLGRMTSKQADGQTVFANAGFAPAAGLPARPHAMKSAETVPNVFPAASQTVTYTGFDKVKTIAEGGNTLEYTYGYDQQRISMVETVGGSIRNKEYVGPCEYIDENNGGEKTSKTLTYLVGPYGVLAVVEQQDNEGSLHYILKDHLGSWTTITDAEGNVEQELSFDAWGNLRNPTTWSGCFTGTPLLDRGFTGHEHLYGFGLINMNGRMYDPVMSSFLSVDSYVQDPENSQNFELKKYFQ
jgi:YD repeat-containing protein